MAMLQTKTSTIYSTLKLWTQALFLTVLWTNVSADTPDTGFDVSSYALVQACAIGGFDCVGVPAPHVDYPVVLQWWGWYGGYDVSSDADGVWMNPMFIGSLRSMNDYNDLAMAVLIHETVHYIDAYLFRSRYMEDVSGCATESRAWHVSNSWSLTYGDPDNIRWDWWHSYENCNYD